MLSAAESAWCTRKGSENKSNRTGRKNPHVPADKLSGSVNRYKIKLRSVGYRLVYEVLDAEIVVVVVAVGKREKSRVYKKAAGRSTE